MEKCKAHGISLRQNYNRVCKALSWQISGYARAKQYKRMNRAIKKHKNRIGRVYRDIERQLPNFSQEIQSQFSLLLEQAAMAN